MADRTPIEWTDASWNPLRGCSRVSQGCVNCYAEVMAARFSGPGQWGEGLAQMVRGPGGKADHRWTGKVVLAEDQLDQPLRWRRPRRIFVNSTSDLFHESVPDDWIDRIFAVMALCPQHTFQMLTKRPERMRAYIAGDVVRRIVGAYAKRLRSRGRGECNGLTAFDLACDRVGLVEHFEHADIVPRLEDRGLMRGWPLPNVWLGTSAEDQATADARIPHLLATPAAVRFVSAEPLLGPLDLTRVGSLDSVRSAFPNLVRRLSEHMRPHIVNAVQIESLGGRHQATTYYQTPDHMGGFEVGSRYYPRLDWIITGGESGPGARPMHPDWARSLRDQCVAAGVAFFHKQNGMWLHDSATDAERWDWDDADQRGLLHVWSDGSTSIRLRKQDAGRLLDGRTWDEMPGLRAD